MNPQPLTGSTTEKPRELRGFSYSGGGAESIRTIQRALELGVTHIDTAEIYGP